MPWDDGVCATDLHRSETGSPTPPPPELVIVDLVAQHDEQSYQQLPGDSHFGLGASTPMDEREVDAPEIGIHAGRMSGGLTEGEAEERAALLGDVPEMILVGRGVKGGGQPDIADHVLAVGEASRRPQYDDGGERGQGADARVGDQTGSIGVRQGRRGDGVVELPDLGVEPGEQLQALIPALRSVRGQRERLQLGQADLAEQPGATDQSVVEGNGVQTIL